MMEITCKIHGKQNVVKNKTHGHLMGAGLMCEGCYKELQSNADLRSGLDKQLNDKNQPKKFIEPRVK